MNLAQSLAEARLRLVLVLDSAPLELVRTTSYLQRRSEGRVTPDLITIASDSVGGTEIVVPQRVDGEAPALDASRPSAKSVQKGELSEGAQVLEDSIASAPVEEQARLRELLA